MSSFQTIVTMIVHVYSLLERSKWYCVLYNIIPIMIYAINGSNVTALLYNGL